VTDRHHPHRVSYLRHLHAINPRGYDAGAVLRLWAELFGVAYADKVAEEAGVKIEPDPLRWMRK